jgi:hypothetical protein
MAFFGVVGSGTFAQGQRPTDYMQNLLYLKPEGDAPITALMSLAKSTPTTDPEYSYRAIEFEARHMVAGVLADPAAVSVPVDGKAFMAPIGTVLRNARTKEQIRVTANPTVDTVMTVTRGFAGSTAAAVLNDDQWTIISTAFEEGSAGPKATNRRGTKYRNFCQIFKEAVEITETAKATKTSTTEMTLADQKFQALERHAQDMERTLIFGRPSEVLGPDGHPLRTTGGILHAIEGTVNDVDLLNDGTIKDFNDFCKTFFTYGPRTRLCFCGNEWISRLNEILDEQVTKYFSLGNDLSIYGMAFNALKTPFGTLAFRTHPLFTTDPSMTNSALIISPEYIGKRTLRPTDYRANQQSPGVDAQMDQWVTETGYEIKFPQTHAYLRNL